MSVAGNKKLVISGTKYGYQFPAGSGSVQCNPKAGYEGTYEFYKAPKLSAHQVFSGKEACKVSHLMAPDWRPPGAWWLVDQHRYGIQFKFVYTARLFSFEVQHFVNSARAVSVHTDAIVQALQHVYGMGRVVEELRAGAGR